MAKEIKITKFPAMKAIDIRKEPSVTAGGSGLSHAGADRIGSNKGRTPYARVRANGGAIMKSRGGTFKGTF